MKVAVCFPGIHRRGGVERVAFETARFLRRAGHHVTLIAASIDESVDAGFERPFDRVPVQFSGRPRFLAGKRFFRSASAALAGLKFDALNTHGCVCPLDGVMWVQSVHGAWLDASRRLRSRASAAYWLQRINPVHSQLVRLEREHFSRRRYRHLVVTTPQVRADLARLYGVPQADTTIVPNGYSPEEFSVARRASLRQEQRARFGFRDDECVLLMVANELARKGYPTLVRALRRLRSEKLKLLLVGRSSQSRAGRFARAAGVGDRLVIAGSSGDVAFEHAAADVFVLPTQYEAMCLAIIEALASGLPVVTSCVPGAQDHIRDGVNGRLIHHPDDDDALAGLLRDLIDPDRREALASHAADSVKHLAWPVVLPLVEQTITKSYA